MTRKRYALNYEVCTELQLQGFIKARTGTVPLPGQRKSFYLWILFKLDSIATFPFLDLIPELRNVVYRELLTVRHETEEKTYCHTNILAACRQVYHEASSIAYEEHTFSVTVRADSGNSGRPTHITVGFDHLPTESIIAAYDRFVELERAWPTFIRKARHLKVKLCLSGVRAWPESDPSRGTYAFPFGNLNALLHSLSCPTTGAASLKTLTLAIKDGCKDDSGQQTLGSILYPVACLPVLEALDVDGLSPETEAYLQQALSDQRQKPNCTDFVAIADRADRALRQCSAIRNAGWGTPRTSELHNLASRVTRRLQPLRCLDGGFYTDLECLVIKLQKLMGAEEVEQMKRAMAEADPT